MNICIYVMLLNTSNYSAYSVNNTTVQPGTDLPVVKPADYLATEY